MSPEERREVAEILAKSDQWTEEILVYFMEWAKEGRIGHMVNVMAARVGTRCQVESLIGIFGLIGMAKVMEICARRSEEDETKGDDE